MAYDGIVNKCIIAELRKYILGCKVNKIYEPTKQDIVLNLYGNGQNMNLAICTNSNFSRVHLTKHAKPNPITAPNFCMLLRKHLTGAKILAIDGYDLERIISISFECYNELNDKINKKLIIEIMGQFSNVILINENGTILDCLNHVVTKTRELLPVRPYEFPTTNKTSFLALESFEDFYKLFSANFDTSIDKTLANLFIGISRSFIQNICNKLEISLDTSNKVQLQGLFDEIKKIINNIDTLSVSCYPSFITNDYYIDICQDNTNSNLSAYLDEFYYDKEQNKLFTSYRDFLLQFLLSTLSKYKKRLNHINDKLKDCDNMENYRLYGELLTSNLYKIKQTPNSIEVFNYYNNSNISIPLDSTLSPSQNVERYYKKFNKCKNTLEIVSKQKKETEEELKYIESLVYSIQDCSSLQELQEIGTEIEENFGLNAQISSVAKPKEQKSSPKKYEINGFTVYVGKNNKQNDLLTKSANKEDMWFHTQKIHGSHVILKTEGKEVDFDTILKCASLAAKNSKAKNSNNVPVDYTFVKYVRKPSGSKPGMAVYVNYKTVFVN